MTFNSIEYFVFLPLVLALYWSLPHRGRIWLLFVASYVFYGWWDPRFLLLIAASTVIDQAVARRIHGTEDERRRRRLLCASLVANLGILGAFKYAGFFVDSANQAFERLGLGALSERSLAIVLPVGISFYTFQTMSYTIDVYRRRMAPADDLLTFAVYVSFFPQLVAGPIERATHLLPQFERPAPRPTAADVRSGGVLILQGIFKKVVIADALAPTVEAAFGRPGQAGAITLLVGVYAFALQIYGDFSGYTDVARGSSRLLGIELMRNFEQPYLSRRITEFWRRWHISLSTWLRDYLYVPLGGNRGGTWRTARNLMLTMLLGGLWHGAAWTFVAWGAIHGLLLAVERPFRQRPSADPDRPFAWRDLPAIIGTFHLVCLAWVFFRATSFANAWDVLAGIATFRGGPVDTGALALLALTGAAVIAMDLAQRRTGDHAVVLRLPAVPRGVVYGTAAVAVFVFSGGTPVPFLYFQF
ncbi:MAG TPA: MBOAT family protein [Acidimicrobiales bacterium]|nr:MBOAT family protein [Acidimicrobiales bacterium]